MFYHASQTKEIKILEPRESNHGIPLIYFSDKRENILVYLSNAVEKYCRETEFNYSGKWSKWGPYGFDTLGRQQIEEYYKDALIDTYKGVSGYIYSTDFIEQASLKIEIPNAFVTDKNTKVKECEYVSDAYEEILKAEQEGLVTVVRYDEFISKRKNWLEEIVNSEYRDSEEHPEYRHFLKGKFGEFIKC